MNTQAGKPYLAILGGKEEDRFTKYLDELLCSPVVLDTFLKEVCGIEGSAGDQIFARTQVTVPVSRFKV